MDTTYFLKMSHAQAAMKAADEIYELRQRVQELEKELEDFESDIDTCTQHNVELQLEVIKLTAERDELLAALGTLADVLANIAITSGLYDPELHALKAACDVIASVKEKQNAAD